MVENKGWFLGLDDMGKKDWDEMKIMTTHTYIPTSTGIHMKDRWLGGEGR